MYNFEITQKIIRYVEDNLHQEMNLEVIANGLNYSKFYLHRIFSKEMGITLNNYITRRRLTEAARNLIYTDRPILEIALISGYQSQQAFSLTFKEMYKTPPHYFRQNSSFYPLQLPYVISYNLEVNNLDNDNWCQKIDFAKREDMFEWLRLLWLVIDGYPGIDINEYIKNLTKSIEEKRAVIIREESLIIAAIIFDYDITEHDMAKIEFIAIHPLFKQKKIERQLLSIIRNEFLYNKDICVTTYREGDKADIGYRKLIKELGFEETNEYLTEFGYPTQRFILRKTKEEDPDG